MKLCFKTMNLHCHAQLTMPCHAMHTDLDQYWKIVQKMFKDQLQTKLILTAYRFNFFVGYRRSEM